MDASNTPVVLGRVEGGNTFVRLVTGQTGHGHGDAGTTKQMELPD